VGTFVIDVARVSFCSKEGCPASFSATFLAMSEKMFIFAAEK